MNTLLQSPDPGRALGPSVTAVARTLDALNAGIPMSETHITATIAAHRTGRVNRRHRPQRPSRRQVRSLFLLAAAGAR